ncbi:MAG: ammonia-forming cytochrome c nitrite reductase subunit c552, partial [Desulfobulbaceae bacterium]|nr:ammonia-forming cytochrome c nitrite reductase subunit c552 [Desulfobulbaceae bacterium]
MKKRTCFKTASVLSIFLACAFTAITATAAGGDNCVSCHENKNPGMYKQWKNSKHAANDVSCIDCHQANKNDVDAFQHHGATIATLVTPKDCSKCHEKEAEQAMNSYHAHAGEILDSADAYLAHVAGGLPVVIT